MTPLQDIYLKIIELHVLSVVKFWLLLLWSPMFEFLNFECLNFAGLNPDDTKRLASLQIYFCCVIAL